VKTFISPCFGQVWPIIFCANLNVVKRYWHSYLLGSNEKNQPERSDRLD
jgi:hypothetical protein